jgi:hypothetical protein
MPTWKPETLRLYADIFLKPRRDNPRSPLLPPLDVDLVVAEALRFMADELERTQGSAAGPGSAVDTEKGMP